MVLIDVLQRRPGLGPQIGVALPHIERHGSQFLVRLGAHEDQLVAAPSPGAFDVNGAGVVRLWTGQHHAQDTRLVEESRGQDVRRWIRGRRSNGGWGA